MPKTAHPVESFDAAIINAAVSFNVNLFLGRGQYDRAPADTLEAAKALAKQMLAAHDKCQFKPMIYAVDASGAAALVTEGATQMIRTETALPKKTSMAAAMAVSKSADADQEARRAKDAKRKRDARAAMKALSANSTRADPFKAASELAALAAAVDQGELAAEPNIEAARIVEDINSRLRPTRKEAEERAAELVKAGNIVGAYHIVKTGRGEFAILAGEKPKGRAFASAPVAVETPKAKVPKAASSEKAAIAEAAKQGVLPPTPDYSAKTHRAYVKRFENVIAMVKARDLAGLKAEPTLVTWATSKMLCTYRDLCIVALEAQNAA